MNSSSLVVALTTAVLFAWLLFPRQKKVPQNATLPPAPPEVPLLGHLPKIPLKHSWLQFFDWSKTYGPLYRLNLAGHDHFVVSTEDIASKLLRDRGAIYSSREQSPSAVVLLSDYLRPLLWPYGEDFRQGRKLMHQLCNPTAATEYQPSQSLESIRMLDDLVRSPDQYERWFERYSAGIIFRIGFGKVLQEDDPLLKRIYGVVRTIERVASPGAYLVDTFPWMMYLPDWMAPFKRELKSLHAEELDVMRTLLEDTRSRSAGGDAPDCWEKAYLENQDRYKLTTDQGAYVVGTLFEAGSSTTAAAMMSFLLAMVLHPKDLEKLQAEVDSVVGPSRLPTFDDIPKLPRVRAVVKEVLRWRPVTAGGVPHKSTQDDTLNVNGKTFFIPEGTNIHPNQWAIHRDESLYPDPESFRPERWLEQGWPTFCEPLETYPNLQSYSAFGFGRRICPGMHIAERSLNIFAARVAWACDWSKKLDVNGQPVTYADYDYVEGFNVQPKPFPFELKARDQDRLRVIQAAKTEAEKNDPLRS